MHQLKKLLFIHTPSIHLSTFRSYTKESSAKAIANSNMNWPEYFLLKKEYHA